MNAKDLMIGDWVMVSHAETNLESKVGKYGRVKMLEYDNNYTGIRIWIDSKLDTYFSEVEEEIEPIPLTVEILEKNGFVDNGPISEYGEDNKMYIAFWKRDLFLEVQNLLEDEDADIHCCYVHELQHALRLCGIKKEITL